MSNTENIDIIKKQVVETLKKKGENFDSKAKLIETYNLYKKKLIDLNNLKITESFDKDNTDEETKQNIKDSENEIKELTIELLIYKKMFDNEYVNLDDIDPKNYSVKRKRSRSPTRRSRRARYL